MHELDTLMSQIYPQIEYIIDRPPYWGICYSVAEWCLQECHTVHYQATSAGAGGVMMCGGGGDGGIGALLHYILHHDDHSFFQFIRVKYSIGRHLIIQMTFLSLRIHLVSFTMFLLFT